MLVNPQVFNYKIIIGSLIIAMTCLGIFGFKTYESTLTEQRHLEQEKNLVEGELSQMLLRYDELSEASNLISSQLDSAKLTTRLALEKLRLMHGDASVLKKFKSELAAIKSKNNVLFNTLDSIHTTNANFEQTHSGVHAELKRQQKLNRSLKKTNTSLKNALKKASLLNANSIKAVAYKEGDLITETTKAAQTNRINVCFTLAENILAQKGEKEIYIQILNPLHNVIGAKGSVNFKEDLLIYSDKQIVHYNNQILDICTAIHPQKNDHPFAKGTYFVSVFLKNRKLGDTQIVLN